MAKVIEREEGGVGRVNTRLIRGRLQQPPPHPDNMKLKLLAVNHCWHLTHIIHLHFFFPPSLFTLSAPFKCHAYFFKSQSAIQDAFLASRVNLVCFPSVLGHIRINMWAITGGSIVL